METYSLRLSVEELALALTQIGQPEVARNLIITHLGAEISPPDVHARIMSAGHSLMARDLLSISEDGSLLLAESLLRTAHALSKADFSIRYSRSHPQADFLLTYHYSAGNIFKHQIEQGVVHHIKEFQDWDQAIQDGIPFFGIPATSLTFPPTTEISKSVLDDIKDEEHRDVAVRKLVSAGVSEELAMHLGEDISTPQYRGSALRVEYRADGAPYSDQGLLILCGHERIWLFRPFIREDVPLLTIVPGTQLAFHQEISSLIHSAS